MEIKRTSTITGKVHILDLPVTPEQIEAWKHGTLLQDAFPNLTKAEREFIKTGVTPKEWIEEFGSPE